MKKQKVMRMYNFSDADLIMKGGEKISFLRRDKAAFAPFGITETMIAKLETNLNAFAQNRTDIEAQCEQMVVTQDKNAKAEELRTAIQSVMKRVEFVFGTNSARYRQFGTKALRRKTDSDLLITAKVVLQVSNNQLQELSGTGITIAMLNAITVVCTNLEQLLHEQNDKIWERNLLRENRIADGNAIYSTLAKYTAIGFAIWESTSVAKYNDYILSNRIAKN